MHRLTRLFVLGIFAVCWLGCAQPEHPTPPELVDGRAEAVSAPWLCQPTSYNPYDVPFVVGQCQWTPSAFTDPMFYPAGETLCNAPGATPSGAIQIYSLTGFAGLCTQIFVPPGVNTFAISEQYMTINGWHTRDSRGRITRVQSFTVGPHVTAYFYNGQLTANGNGVPLCLPSSNASCTKSAGVAGNNDGTVKQFGDFNAMGFAGAGIDDNFETFAMYLVRS